MTLFLFFSNFDQILENRAMLMALVKEGKKENFILKTSLFIF